LQHHATQVGEQLAEIRREARRLRAVDDAVIVRQRHWQHQSRREFLAVPNWLGRALRHTEDRDLGGVDDRRERRAADATERRDRKAAALHVGGAELAFARLRRELAHFLRDLENALLTGVLDDRNDEPFWR